MMRSKSAFGSQRYSRDAGRKRRTRVDGLVGVGSANAVKVDLVDVARVHAERGVDLCWRG